MIEEKGINRRKFLKFLGIGSVAAPIVVKAAMTSSAKNYHEWKKPLKQMPVEEFNNFSFSTMQCLPIEHNAKIKHIGMII